MTRSRRTIAASLVAALSPVAATLSPVAAQEVIGPTGSITGRCDYAVQATPNSNDGTVAIVGHALSEGVATGVRCILRSTFSGTVVYDRTVMGPGRATPLVDAKTVQVTPYTVCWQGSALYADATYVQTPLICLDPAARES